MSSASNKESGTVQDAVQTTVVTLDSEGRYDVIVPDTPKLSRKERLSPYFTILAAAFGLVSDGYHESVMTMANVVFEKLHPTEYTSAVSTRVSNALLVGCIIGQISVGFICDRFGRKVALVGTTLLIVIGAILTTAAHGAHGSVQGLFWFLTIARGIVGVGVGGEYPASSTSASESANEKMIESRGPILIMATELPHSQFGGPLAVGIFLIVLSAAGEDHLNTVWRVCFGIGIILPLSVFYFRMQMLSSALYKKGAIKSRVPYRLVIKRYWKSLIGTCGAWFIYDFVTFPNEIFSGAIISSVIHNGDIKKTAEWQLLLETIELPGRVNTMMLGFAGYIVFGLIIGLAYDRIVKIIPLFVIFFGLIQSFGNLGPGDITIVVSAESYPTAVRGTCYGLSAALGKTGAALGTQAFTPIQNNLGKKWTFIIEAICGVVGILVTYFFVPDMTGVDLADEDRKFMEYLAENGWEGDVGEDDVSLGDVLGDEEKNTNTLALLVTTQQESGAISEIFSAAHSSQYVQAIHNSQLLSHEGAFVPYLGLTLVLFDSDKITLLSLSRSEIIAPESYLCGNRYQLTEYGMDALFRHTDVKLVAADHMKEPQLSQALNHPLYSSEKSLQSLQKTDGESGSVKDVAQTMVVTLDSEGRHGAMVPDGPKLSRKERLSPYFTILAAAFGLVSDGYHEGVMTMTNVVLEKLYPTEYTSAISTRVSNALLVGCIIGQVSVGFICDRFGRKFALVGTTLLIVLGAVLTTAAHGAHGSVQGLFWFLTIARGIVGVGVGGEYPASSASASESANESMIGNRGPILIMATNFVLAFGGPLAVGTFLIVLSAAGEDHLTTVWRVCFGIGIILPLSVFYFRMQMLSSVLYKKGAIKHRVPYWLIIKRYWKSLIGTCGAWFIFDFVTFPNQIFSAAIISSVIHGGDIKKTAEWQLLLEAIALPGVFLGAYLCNRLGRVNTMMLGFAGYIVFGLIIGLAYDRIVKITPLFVIFFGLIQSSGNMGPGDITIVVSAESYPTAVRGTCYGLSAALGKTGAALGTQAFTPIQNNLGKKWTFIIEAICGAAGILVTYFFVRDMTGVDLADEDRKFMEYLAENGWEGDVGEDGVLLDDISGDEATAENVK
ncbi:hypothetical protein NM688_g3385 [Phlebia brevispora]|uniref:Uncharacterized protein n=1 Tax=Phlebia brevispora TaxID=194682 RepID=A0ACC1T617_9APHY|nr:hypothetical protein NM688_g3385 [Phlebia brevispora]